MLARPTGSGDGPSPQERRNVKPLPRIELPGGIDADGHILEPPDLWLRYLDPRHRDRALRIRTDPEGREYVEIDGRPSKLIRNGMPGGQAALDSLRN